MKKIIFALFFTIMSTNLFAAQTQIAQVNGMMCIKCQKMVTEALQKASPDADIRYLGQKESLFLLFKINPFYLTSNTKKQ